jgi:hypothetical protein
MRANSNGRSDSSGCQTPKYSTPECPVCGGMLIELRGQGRCSRCQFLLCADCDGFEHPDDSPVDG